MSFGRPKANNNTAVTVTRTTDDVDDQELVVINTSTTDQNDLIANLQANISNLEDLIKTQTTEWEAKFAVMTAELDKVRLENAALITEKNNNANKIRNAATRYSGTFIHGMSARSLADKSASNANNNNLPPLIHGCLLTA